MSTSSALGELAADASLERNAFLATAGDQLRRFLAANKDRIKEVGGLVLIDDDPDYLSVAPDGSFRSRTRYQDEVTGEWNSETEIIESAAELVEIYNPADVLAAFAEAAREQAGLPAEPTATDDLMDAAGISPEETVGVGVGEDEFADAGYAAAADDWARGQAEEGPPATAEDAARRLYDLALTFQERSQHSEARLVEQFETTVQELAPVVGDLMILDDEDERLWLKRNGRFEAEVVPERDPDDPDDGKVTGAASRHQTRWSSSTTRQTSLATWPRQLSTRSPAVAADEEADEEADPFEDDEDDEDARSRGRR